MSWAGILSFISAIPTIVRAVMALISMAKEVEKHANDKKAEDVREEIKNAETEDDFRKAADDLTHIHD